METGTILEGKVTSITKFGAFVALESGRSGLVHISEIANTYVNDVNDYLEKGQAVKVMVLSDEEGKLNLSIKRTEPKADRPAREPRRPGEGRGNFRPEGRSDSRGQRPEGRTENRGDSRSSFRPAPRMAEPQEQTFEDKLKKFLSSSEGKMADLNRSMDGKRGKRRR